MGMVAAGAYLRAYRRRLGLSQADVAVALGKSQAKVITDWESGKRVTSVDLWNLWIEMVGANPATAQRLVIYGKSLEEGQQVAELEFTSAVKKATRAERDDLIIKIKGILDHLHAVDGLRPTEEP